MIDHLKEQFSLIILALGFILLFVFVSSVIVYLIKYLSSRELSDQFGWLNFKKVKIGLTFFLTGIMIVFLFLMIFLIFFI